MKFLGAVAALLYTVGASAVEYSSLRNVIDESSVHTVRLSELSAQVESQGPMNQVGDLCYKQMREISAEVDELDSTHQKFQSMCLSTLAKYNTEMNALAVSIATNDRKSADMSVKWNNIRPMIPPIRRRRERFLAQIVEHEANIVIGQKKRDATKAAYDQDMSDFAQALQDIDALKKILTTGAISDRQTSGNIAKQGFLEAMDTVQSDKLKQMTNRLTEGANFLAEKQSADEPSGVDKIMNLLLKIRNEMWAEMSKLTKIEGRSIFDWKTLLKLKRRTINALHIARAREYIKIGRRLSEIGHYMLAEAAFRITSSKRSKEIDRLDINKHFLRDSCAAEPPMFQKSRSVKTAEMDTINQMLKILRNLKWSGAVYNAISRISVGGVDENPEPGFTIGYQMDVHTGLVSNNYAISNSVNKDFGRVAIKVQIGSAWVWASFDAWTTDASRYLVPTIKSGVVNQRYIDNLVVHKSPSLKTLTSTTAAKGNVEMWATNYGTRNVKKIPNGSDGNYDLGDERAGGGNHGCFQVHDYLGKQTVFAVNHFLAKDRHDVGLGTQGPVKGSHPDWTFAQNSGRYKARKEAITITWYFLPKSAMKPIKHTK